MQEQAAWQHLMLSAGWKMPNINKKLSGLRIKAGKTVKANSFASLKPLKKAIQQANQAKNKPSSKAYLAEAVPDDTTLFKQATKNVVPLKAKHKTVLTVPPGATYSRDHDLFAQRRQHAMGNEFKPLAQVSDTFTSIHLQANSAAYLKPGQSPSILKKLRKGKWSQLASIDLHGYQINEAREHLVQYLSYCTENNISHVHIVHGKGYGSKNGESKLKTTVRRWLAQLSFVLAYVECPDWLGGSGAVLVMLEKWGD